MPRSKECGFIFLDKNGSEEALIRTMAHELGHGAFSLKHTFADEKYTTQQGSTDNLMDYTLSGTALCKYQWDGMRYPEIVIGLFEDDDAGAMSSLDITDEKYREIAIEDGDHIGGLEMASEIINHLYNPDNSIQRNFNSDKKFKITVRSFLPYLYVLDPLNNPASGRNRIDLANIRDYPQYLMLESMVDLKPSRHSFLIFLKTWLYTIRQRIIEFHPHIY